MQVIEAERVVDSRLREELSATCLGPERKMTRVSAIERNTETQGEISLEERCVVADEMRAVLIGDANGDLLQQARAFEDLETERTRRVIIRREQGEPSQGVAWD